MSLDFNQQITASLHNAKHILLVTSAIDTGDGLASLLALKLLLHKLNKPADLVVTEQLTRRFSFLPGNEHFQTTLNTLKRLIITLDITNNKIKEFNYDIQDNKLKIFITPEQAELKKDVLSVDTSDYAYDLILSIGCPDLASLGSFYFDQPDFFYQTTLINIDNNPANERYGQINHIDLNPSSCSEIIFSFLTTNYPDLFDPLQATALLAGLIVKTDNFRSASVTPDCLYAASTLMKLGANQNLIIDNLNRNKSLTALNLWGRVLARLKQDTHYHLAWSLISQSDFQKSGGSLEDLSGVVSELISRSPLIEITVLLYELPTGQIDGQIFTTTNYNALDLTNLWQGVGQRNQALFHLNEKQLISAEQLVINHLHTLIHPGNH